MAYSNERHRCATDDDVTDDDVKICIKGPFECRVDDMLSHLRDAFAKVKFKPDRSDPGGTSLQFFADVAIKMRRSRM